MLHTFPSGMLQLGRTRIDHGNTCVAPARKRLCASARHQHRQRTPHANMHTCGCVASHST
eukprot:6622769-Alexandrium_andersonii.AAC.1